MQKHPADLLFTAVVNHCTEHRDISCLSFTAGLVHVDEGGTCDAAFSVRRSNLAFCEHVCFLFCVLCLSHNATATVQRKDPVCLFGPFAETKHSNSRSRLRRDAICCIYGKWENFCLSALPRTGFFFVSLFSFFSLLFRCFSLYTSFCLSCSLCLFPFVSSLGEDDEKEEKEGRKKKQIGFSVKLFYHRIITSQVPRPNSTWDCLGMKNHCPCHGCVGLACPTNLRISSKKKD